MPYAVVINASYAVVVQGTSSGDFFDDPLLTRLSSGYGNTDKSATQVRTKGHTALA
jgi:hypothetical protein